MRYLFLLIIVVFTNCKKPNNTPQLPPISHSGANTLGCLIDGKVFSTSGQWNNFNPIGVLCTPLGSQGHIHIIGNDVINIDFQYLGSPGTFEMGNLPYRAYYWNYDNGTFITGGNEFKTDSINKGAVTISNYNAYIISGTFWFNGINDSGIVVHVTDGRFDIKL